MATLSTAQSSLRRGLTAALVAMLLASAVGCVQRRMTVRSNPPGAQVYVDNYEIGRTPVSTDFVYYGKRNIRLVKDGYETMTVTEPVRPPWYQWPGVDFIAETLTPWEIRDERNFNYQMQPLMVVPSESLLSRAEELRRSNPVPAAAAAPQAVPTSPYMVPAPGATPAPPSYGTTPTYGVAPSAGSPTAVPTLPPNAPMGTPVSPYAPTVVP